MNLDLGYDPQQLALQDSIDGFCQRSGTGPLFATDDPLPDGFWQGLAELGVLGLGSDFGGGGALDIAAAMETLGAHGAPGPLVGTFIAAALLKAGPAMEEVAGGQALVSVGSKGLYPWASLASTFIEIDGDNAWRVEPPSDVVSVNTTAGEPWGRCQPTRLSTFDAPGPALAHGEVAISAYLVGAAGQLLALGAEYARDRVQFNKPISTFQAVSHPLAVAATRLNASRVLTRGAAQKIDARSEDWTAAASTARLSAVGVATAAAYQAHQLFGAMGFTLEGPVAHLSHRIRQVGMLPPAQSRARDLVLGTLSL